MRAFIILALVAAPAAASAQNLEGMRIADSLGTVIASEEICGLTYDQAAIAGWIEANAPADDLQFPSFLNTSVQGKGFMLKSMSGSAKTAHCAAVSKTAKSYGFLK